MPSLLDEILQQPAALSMVRKYYTSAGAIPLRGLKSPTFRKPATVIITGMGSSLNAAYPAQAFLTGLGIRAILWETAELLHHHLKVLKSDTVLVVVSQSGETAEVVNLIEQLPRKIALVAISNVERSTLARRADLSLPMMAGGQTTVSTKTYTKAVAVLMYLAFALARKSHAPLTQAVIRATEAQEQIIEARHSLLPPTVEFFNRPPYVVLMSRGADLCSAYQGALTLKEVARLAAEPMSAAQFRHGPIEIIHPDHRYIIFARHNQPSGKTNSRPADLLLRLAGDIRAHGGRVLLLTDRAVEAAPNLRLIQAEPIRLGLGTLVDIVTIQLLANELAARAGIEPGKFWIAEPVTRTE
jgi:glucosamine--fructose-6-phosphate aminotransferase (isomerizing)